MLIVDPDWSFEEAIIELSTRYYPGGASTGPQRNAYVDAWGMLVGRTRALREFDETIARYRNISNAAKVFRARVSTLQGFRAVFDSLPDDSLAYAGKLQPGNSFGPWKLHKKLGRGGNAEVWHVVGPDGLKGALKIPFGEHFHRNAFLRFRAEVTAMQMLAGVEGVPPLIDFHLPSDFDKNDLPWLVMPIAVPMKSSKKLGELASVVNSFYCIATTLSKAHLLSVSHRDVKPENLFEYGEKWAVGDFGIASFPGKEALTKEGKKLGPMYYIAPEMLNNASRADGAKADVYSLAKSLWVVASGMSFPIPGQLRSDDSVARLSTYCSESGAVILELLLNDCTHNDPELRPAMSEVVKNFEDWLSQWAASPNS